MSAKQIIFYLLSATLLSFGFLSVTSRQIFRSAIYLLFALVGIAGVYFLMGYEFIAAVQIVVYVGGIVVLILFAVFLTHKAGEDMPAPAFRREMVSFVLVFLAFALSVMLMNKHMFRSSGGAALEPSVKHIGLRMLDISSSGIALPFEVVSILLLSAMVGAIVIALKTRSS